MDYFLKKILEEQNKDLWVETGMFKGRSAMWAIELGFKKVISLEINETLVKENKIKFSKYIEKGQLEIIQGDSAKNLENVLQKHPNISVLFLDAHGDSSNDAPLEAELKILSKYYKNNYLVIIDDYIKIKHFYKYSSTNWKSKFNYYDFMQMIQKLFLSFGLLPYIHYKGRFHLKSSLNCYLLSTKIGKIEYLLNIIKQLFFSIYIIPGFQLLKFYKKFIKK